MRADDLTYYGQAKACPFFVLAAGQVALIKALPDLVLVFFGNADPAVLDADKDFAALFRRLNLNLRVTAAEFDRVVDEIVEDLLYFVHVGVNIENFAGQDQMDPNVLSPADLLEGSCHFADHVVDIPVGHLQDHSPGIEIVEGQKAVGQLGEALGLIEDDAEIVFVHFRRDRAVQHRFQKAPDGSQGRAEVVGDVGDELFLVVFKGRHRPGHIAKGRGKISHLVFALHVQLIVHIAGRILLRRRDDPSKRPVDELGEEDQDDQGQEQDDDQHQIGDVEHTVGVLVNLCRGLVDDDIAPGLVVVDDRRDDAQLLLFKGVKKRASRVVILLRHSRIKALYHNFLLRIRRARGVDDHAPGGVDDPNLRVHEIGEGLHLFLHCIERDLGIIQVYGIGVGNTGRFAVHIPRRIAKAVLVGEPRDKSRHCEKAEEGEQNVGQYEL